MPREFGDIECTSEDARRSDEVKLRVALKASGMAAWHRDLVGGPNYWSEQMWVLCGIPPADVPPPYEEFVEKVVYPPDWAAFEESVHQVERGEPRRLYHHEFRIIRQDDGAVRWLASWGEVIRDDSGRAVAMAGVTMDITDRMEAERERADLLHREQQARAEAEAANRRKDQFLAVLSHELRTPLTPVLGRLGLLERMENLPPEVLDAVDMIRRNVQLEIRLIDDLLDLTQVAGGKLVLDLRNVDAHERLLAAMDIYRTEADAKRLAVDLDLRAERHHVRADPVRLQQVFWNLIGNAVKFTPAGGRITLRTANTADGRLLIQVEDTGIGIDPQLVSRLFDAFEQGEPTLSRRYGGLGLGLSIAKSLVEMLGGTVTAVSEGRGKGSVFTVELKTVDDIAMAPQPGATAPSATLTEAQPPATVLVVEDNADTLWVLGQLLRGLGYNVLAATTAEGAMRAAASHRFDLLLCDIGLPDGTGWELLQRLRAQRPVKAIAVSGFVQPEDLQRSQAAGFARHLTKPVDARELETTLQQALSGAPMTA